MKKKKQELRSPAKKIPPPRKRAVSRSAFVGAVALALAAAIFLIIMGRTVSTRDDTGTSPKPTPVVSGTQPSASVQPQPSMVVSGTSKGLPGSPVTIVEYEDFQCSFCQQFSLTTEPELDKLYIETGKAKMIYKHRIIYGEESMRTAIASECSAEQDKFWPYHDLLMQLRASPKEADLSIEKLKSLALLIGLDTRTFNACLDSEKYKEKVTRDDNEGKAAQVTGTPTFFINGTKSVGAAPLKDFQRIIDSLLERKPAEGQVP